MTTFLTALGAEVEDAYEETIDLFSRRLALSDLGMVDPRASTLTLTIGGRDYTIKQSPGILQSSLPGGTTGAAVWTSSVRLARWLWHEDDDPSNKVDPNDRTRKRNGGGGSSSNPIFQLGLLNETSIVLELGSGIAGLVPSVLFHLAAGDSPESARGPARIVATDQEYALKLLRQNILRTERSRPFSCGVAVSRGNANGQAPHASANRGASTRESSDHSVAVWGTGAGSSGGGRKKGISATRPLQSGGGRTAGDSAAAAAASPDRTRVEILSLDWEEDDIPQFMARNFGEVCGCGGDDARCSRNESTGRGGVDVVFASDTVYNYALIESFVQTCVDVCRARGSRWHHFSDGDGDHNEGRHLQQQPTVCIIVQRLRQEEVFEQWMQAALAVFHVWRVPPEMLVDGIRVEDGFVVHVLTLRS